MAGIAMMEMKLIADCRLPIANWKRGKFLAMLPACLLLCLILQVGLLASDETTTPFYYASSTPMDVQPRMLIIGVNESIGQAVVSQDRKHVTLNMDAGLLGNAGIQKFNYQRGGLGFVGSAPKQVSTAAGNGLTPTIPGSAGEIAPPVSMLDKPGMVLIASLER
jgi:hypothetical protein